jgi:hypothetical protein
LELFSNNPLKTNAMIQKIYKWTFTRGVLFTALCIFSFYPLFAGGIRGTVTADDGNPLPFATIFVKQTGSSTVSSENGFYEISLPAGSYEMVYLYMGYETQARQVEVGNGFVEINIVLKSVVFMLEEVKVNASREDPAYTIMRKAIAKAKYHTQFIDNYSARVYIKGASQLKDYPWLFKKWIGEEGDNKDIPYVSESLSEIRYSRPNTFEEKVISVRSVGKDNNTSPQEFIFGSFYEPEIAGIVSPLSPKAFLYYDFEYLGTFQDRSYQVSRIKVTPRSEGDDVLEGIINIVDDWWSIHSLDMHAAMHGIVDADIDIKIQYAPIEDKAWLPVSQQFKINGEFLGFEGEYNYLATLSAYQITMNPELYVEKMEVIDEKLEKKPAKDAEQKHGKKDQQLKERIASGNQISRKELNKMLKDYEKQERKMQKEPEVIANTNYTIDSLAYKKNDAYFDSIRPVPLSPAEIKGYQVIDSLAEIKRKKEEGDTLKKSRHKGFQFWDIVIGDHYKVSKHSDFRIHTPIPNFNTIEGLNLAYRLTFGTVLQDTNKTNFNISPVFRYAFSREKFSGYLTGRLYNKKYRLEISGGRYIRQFNGDDPIWPVVNTFTTLFLEQNLMKLYERDFADLLYNRKLNRYITVNTSWYWMRRYQLFNTSDYKLINRKNVEGYTPNAPVNEKLMDTGFPTHEAFIGFVSIAVRPWLKYRIHNGNKMEIPGSSPVLSLDYRKGFDYLLGSDVHFDQLELGLKHAFDAGIFGKVNFALRGGMFLSNDKMYFMDYKHFLGNRTPFSTADPVGSFRLLDYYNYSTPDKYFVANVHYQFRRFLITSFLLVRMAGIRENIFVNYLATPNSGNYTELGYSIDGIWRFFRLEAAATFRNGRYLDTGFRIGIATSIGAVFSDN